MAGRCKLVDDAADPRAAEDCLLAQLAHPEPPCRRSVQFQEHVVPGQRYPRSLLQILPGALNLPLDDLDELAPVLVPDKSAAVVTYCSNTSCRNSAMAAERLRAMGYTDVRAYEGGKQDWIEAGLPVESGGAVGG